MAHLHSKSKEGRKQTNQQLGFNSLHSLTLGNFLFPQFFKYRLLFSITLLQHLSLVVFHPGNHKNQSASLLKPVVHPNVVCWLLCYRCWNSADVGFLLQFSSSLSNSVCCPCLSCSSYPTEIRIKDRNIPSDGGLKVMTLPWLLLDQLWRKGLVTSCRLEW